ncbi:MAG: AmmeMemoRadiSam system protein B [Phycisphaerales bacterium]
MPPLSNHLEFPRLRPIEAIPMEHDGQKLFALRDPSQRSEHMLAVSEAAMYVAQHFDGSNSISTLAGALRVSDETLRPLVEQLDAALFLHGPTFERFARDQRDAFDRLERLPVRAAEDFTADRIERAFDAAPTPTLRGEVVGLVAPHLDFERGAANYAAAWRSVSHVPDRVIVLGTNHFGGGDGVTMCRKGFDTPLGPLRCDDEFARRLLDRLGPALVEHEIDHAREHSVELQMPWIRRAIGEVPVLGFLVHDPTVNDGRSYTGSGVGLDDFVQAVRQETQGANDVTLFVASADLSHVGLQFGDSTPNSPERLAEVERHDRTHLDLLLGNKVDRFVDSMKESRNHTRWCTLGGMTALWKIIPDATAELVRYEQSIDEPEDGVCCVTSAAIILSRTNR